MYISLPNDVTRCFGAGCGKRSKCKRYLTLYKDHQADLIRKMHVVRPLTECLGNAETGECDYFMEDK
jgi:hypothetical protein